MLLVVMALSGVMLELVAVPVVLVTLVIGWSVLMDWSGGSGGGAC